MPKPVRPTLPIRPMRPEQIAQMKTIRDIVDGGDNIDTGTLKVVVDALVNGMGVIRKESNGRADNLHGRLDEVLRRVNKAIHIAIADRPERKEIDALLQPLRDWQNSMDSSPLASDVGYAIDMLEGIVSRITTLEEQIENKTDSTQEEAAEQVTTVPDHEWNGSRIRFKKPDGSWGEYKDLRGMPGPVYEPMEQPFGHTAGVARVRGGANTTVISDGNGGVVISTTGGSSSGSIIAATDSGDHKNYSLAQAPTTSSYYLIINGGIYTSDDPTYGAWSVTGTTLTFTTALPADVAGTVIKLVCV